jgi:DNA oxidative demethylase
MSTHDLFGGFTPEVASLSIGTFHLRGFATSRDRSLLAAIEDILTQAPWRHMQTAGGFTMSVAMSNCGSLGWISDRKGYRYSQYDPLTGQPWPAIPLSLLQLASEAASKCGFAEFVPDACLINCYTPGARMHLHQDKDEQDFSAPIVSVSLGVDAEFLLGGMQRSDKPGRLLLQHGDVVVWGGEDRLRFHGILPIEPQRHPLTGENRINLTFRKAG